MAVFWGDGTRNPVGPCWLGMVDCNCFLKQIGRFRWIISYHLWFSCLLMKKCMKHYETMKISHISFPPPKKKKKQFQNDCRDHHFAVAVACHFMGTPLTTPCLEIVRSKPTVRCQAAGWLGFIYFKKLVFIQKRHDYTLVNYINWQWKMNLWRCISFSTMRMFHGYVSLQEGSGM